MGVLRGFMATDGLGFFVIRIPAVAHSFPLRSKAIRSIRVRGVNVVN
jgi:hypothetical protein